MAALNALLRGRNRKYPEIASDEVRTILINPGDRLLTEITPDLAAYADGRLKERGVEIRMNTRITGASGTCVELEGGERIRAGTLIWAAGIKPNPLVEQLSCDKGKDGGIKVNSCCEVPGHPGIWALGDCAEIPQANGKGSYAPTAQNATREGRLVARNIVAAERGVKAIPFRYTPVGELALVGRHAGVARIYGLNFSGFLAWAMWRATYLVKMPGTAQKVRILSDWLLDMIFGRDPITIGPHTPALKRKNEFQ
jgi:NADH dehydrogenase